MAGLAPAPTTSNRVKITPQSSLLEEYHTKNRTNLKITHLLWMFAALFLRSSCKPYATYEHRYEH